MLCEICQENEDNGPTTNGVVRIPCDDCLPKDIIHLKKKAFFASYLKMMEDIKNLDKKTGP